MKSIILILFLSGSLISSGQIINASAPYRSFAAAIPPEVCTYPLDTYTGSSAAYSVRKLSSSYSGKALKVRRSSDDAEQDVDFIGCELDTASMKTFVGANNGFVTKWYDQSGNGRDAVQATSGLQPKIINSGLVYRKNGRVSIFFDGNGLCWDGSGFAVTAHSTFAVWYPSGSVADARVLSFRNSGSIDYEHYVAILSTGSAANSYAGGYVSPITVSTSSLNLFQNINTGSATNNYLNAGSASNSSNSFSISLVTYSIGSIASSSCASGALLTGYISEAINYPSDQSSNRTGMRDNINTYFTIY